MIYTFAQTNDQVSLENVSVDRLFQKDIKWFWVDFDAASDEEVMLLSEVFQFSPLAIEDCLERIERPKMDYYDAYNFFILHSLIPESLQPVELDVFVGENYVVSYHKTSLIEIEHVRQRLKESETIKDDGHHYITYLLFDKIVDQYFPLVYKIEDKLNEIDIGLGDEGFHNVIDQVFKLRTSLLKLRYTINSMKELVYRILNSEHLEGMKMRNYNDIYDHLLKLADSIETSREVTSDVRDNYLSMNSHKMNKIMTILTVISSIFIPLTFLVGVYGMNFDYMPELRWRYGYFFVLGAMAVIGISMLVWFIRKGWFDFKK